MKLLVLSNGHGEDAIAVRILEQLQQHPHAPQLAALPIVGEGKAYQKLNIPIIGPVQKMPSGGFIYMDRRQFWQDIKGGLLQLTLAQYQAIQNWGKTGGKILAVGDIVPLLFAWLSGAEYAFVGTAKSEYYLRDETAWLTSTSALEKWLGSVYLPWERWLMSHPHCKAVFPRDRLTAKILQQWTIPAFDLGNPMMDGIESSYQASVNRENYSLRIVLLPGSRMPEAQRNWQKILPAVEGIISAFSDRSLLFLAAIAPYEDIFPFQRDLLAYGWNLGARETFPLPIEDPQKLIFTRENATLALSQQAYIACLQETQVAIAMAGTATEQFVGLGKPAIAIVGEGPQFTSIFAEAQTRLLGESLILVSQPQEVVPVLQSLLQDRERLEKIAANGRQRMGEAGAARRIAESVLEVLG
jgi:uncharacterized protein (TIGR03492 family)